MRRKDMQPHVLYAINISGFVTRPGFVLETNEAPHKVKVQQFWRWPGQDDDYLNPTPPITDEQAKGEVLFAKTSEILEPWADYCVRIKAERKAVLDKRNAEDAEAEAQRQRDIARVAAVASLVPEQMLRDLQWIAGGSPTGSRMTQREFSAKEVLDLIEHLTGVSQ